MVSGIGKFIHELDIVSPVTEMVTSKIKQNVTANYLNKLAKDISGSVIETLSDIFDEEIFAPILDDLQYSENELAKVKEGKRKNQQEAIKKFNSLKNEIKELKKL